MTERKKTLPALLMTVVILAGLIIGFVGIYLVSQQKNARLLDVRNEFALRLSQIAQRVETRTRQEVEKAFQQVEKNKAAGSDPEILFDHTKTLVLNNPVIKYPFFIDSRRRFLFPFSRKTVFPGPTPPALEGKMANPRAKEFYIKGYRLEYRQRNFIDAVMAYRSSLGANPGEDFKPYIYHSIARCYFKLNRFAQAAYYYRRILNRCPAVLAKDNLLYFTVLRRLALSYKQMDAVETANRFYLRLYEEVLRYDAAGKTNPYAFYKNEALDYLNRHIRGGGQSQAIPAADAGADADSDADPLTRTRTAEQLKKTSALDISLRWLYFEVETTGDRTGSGETGGPGFRFLRLRELYESMDEKSRFYNALKNSPYWSGSQSPGLRIEALTEPGSTGSERTFYFVFQPVTGEAGRNTVYFGFMLSLDFIRDNVIRPISREFPGFPSVFVDVSVPGAEGGTGSVALLSVPFRGRFPGEGLTLCSFRRDYFETIVRRDIHLYYGFLGALMVTMAAGIFLFFKYLSREADLVRLKSGFVDSVSHTLKTPLTRISLLAENMARGWVSEESRKKEFFYTIISETGRMSEVIDNMLNFSRVEAGKQHYKMEKAYLQEIVAAVAARYTAYIENHGFQLTVDMADDVPALMLDPAAVRLIVGNLLQNALKYSLHEKTVKIRVYRSVSHPPSTDGKPAARRAIKSFDQTFSKVWPPAGPPEAPGEYAVFAIEDRGIGIPGKEIPHIFKKFFRVPGSEVSSIEGSGLGLFLVHHAADAHGGCIEVESREGQGTVFRVYFPMDGKKTRGREETK